MLSRSDLQKLSTAKLLKQSLAFPFGMPLAFSPLQMSGDWRPLRRMAGSSVDPLTSVEVERCFQVFVKSALTEGPFISSSYNDRQNATLATQVH